MGFAITLHLRRFVETFPASTVLGVVAINRLVGERFDQGKHPTVRQVAVVRNGEHLAAGLSGSQAAGRA